MSNLEKINADGFPTYPSFFVGQSLRVFQLGGQGDLDLAQLGYLGLSLFQLSQEVGVLNGQLLLGGVEVVEGSVGFVQFALDFVELVLELLGDLLGGGLERREGLLTGALDDVF